MPIIWKLLDGTIHVTQLEDGYLERERRQGESTDDAVLRLASAIKAKVPKLKDATAYLVKTADMPVNRTERNQWRITDGKITIVAK